MQSRDSKVLRIFIALKLANLTETIPYVVGAEIITLVKDSTVLHTNIES